jgi:hypothetical protein
MRHSKLFLSLMLSLILVSVTTVSCSNDKDEDLDIDGTDQNDDDDNDDDGDSDNDDSTDTTDSSVYDITSILALFDGTGLSYEISGDNVIFTTADLPDHGSPYWDQSNDLYEAYNGTNDNFNLNPNTIEEKNIVFTIPLKPAAAANKEATGLGPIGISRNGVVFFNQYAGPNNQPLTSEINSFDQGAGHPTGTSTYHYHVEPLFLTAGFGANAFLGLLSDGFPVYGPIENDVAVSNDDLDDFHGHIGVTADFPDGIYHYHITDADPYINGNGYYGTPGNISN